MRKYTFLLIALTAMAFSCVWQKEPAQENVATPYALEAPAKFPKISLPEDNPMTVEGVAMGRRIYYDRSLNTQKVGVACSDCHQQKAGFSSPGEKGQLAIMPHVNLAYETSFLWNGAEQGILEDVMLFEIKDFFAADLSYVNADAEYKRLAKVAFGKDDIDYQTMAYALAQFSRTQLSGNSKFDQYNRGEIQLSEQEKRGLELFFSEDGDCFHCHSTVLFSDSDFHNIGLDSTFNLGNAGRYVISQDSVDIGKFKTPSLRNIAVSAPYMHDNRFETLEQVVDFYAEGVHFTKYTDPLMKHEGGINLNQQQRVDLIAFLNTLTDESYLSNEELSNPFNTNEKN